jgi:hypothetical protein
MDRFLLTVCFSLAILWNLGCSKEQPKAAAPAADVKGTITMDGRPIPTGELHFESPSFPPRILKIKDGSFSGEAPVGKNQVELFLYVDGPASEKYPGVPAKKNVAPVKYWGPKTILEATVIAGGANEFKFDIRSK